MANLSFWQSPLSHENQIYTISNISVVIIHTTSILQELKIPFHLTFHKMIDVDINESNAAFLAKFRVPAPPIPPKAGRPTAADIVSSSSLKSGKISAPKNPPIRKVDFMPYEVATLSSDIKRVNDPYEHKLRNALFFLILSVGFLSSFLLGVHPEVCLLLSLIFFSIASYAFATHFHKMHEKGKKDD